MVVRNVITMDQIGDKIVLCKATTALKNRFGDRIFTRGVAQIYLIRSIKVKKFTPGRSREYIPEAMSVEQASRIFDVMVSRGYIEFDSFYTQKPHHPSIIAAKVGEKMYRFGNLRLAECYEMSWYKNRERKEKFVQKEKSIDTRSCKSLQQIYTMFGNMPFSYNTVTEIAKMINDMSKSESTKFNPAELAAFKHMKAKLYGYDSEGFRTVWQSLIRNGYIVQHKIKTPDGYIKNTGLYRINPAYLQHCLAELV